MSASSFRSWRTAAAPDSSGAAVWPLTGSEIAAIGALLAAVAFAFSPSLDSQFTLPKLAAFYGLLAVFALLWSQRLRRGGLVRPPRPIMMMTGALVLWWLVTLPFAVHLRTALWGSVGRGNGLVQHVALVGWFIALASMRIGVAGTQRVGRIMLGILAVLSAYAIFQAAGWDVFVWPNVRPGSTIGHPVPLAAILALGAPLGLAEVLAARSPRAIVAAGIATSMIVFALGTTLSRGPWIGAAIGLALTVVLAVRGGADRRARTIAIAGCAVLVVAATVWVGRVPGTRITQRLALLTRLTTDPSFMNRFEYFSAALTMVRQRPLAGAGFESFGLLFPPLRPVEAASVDDDTIPTMVHNGPLQMAVATGMPGAILFFALQLAIVAMLMPALRRRGDGGVHRSRVVAIGLLGALVAFWIQDLSGWEEISSSLFFWTVAGLAVALRTSDDDAPLLRIKSGRAAMALTIAVAAAFAAASWTMVRELEIDRVLHAAGSAPPGEWPATLSELNRIRGSIDGDSAYLDRMAIVYLNRMRAAPNGATYAAAIDVARRASDGNHFDPYILIHFVDAETLALLSRVKRAPAADAIEAADRLGTLDPHNASAREAVARFRLATGSAVAALRELRVAIELRPQRQGLRLLEGDIHRALGDQSAALVAYRAETAMHDGVDPIWVAAQQKVTASLLAAGDQAGALREAQLLTTRVPADAVGRQLLEAARR